MRINRLYKTAIVILSSFLLMLIVSCFKCDCEKRKYSSFNCTDLSTGFLQYEIKDSTPIVIRSSDADSFFAGTFGIALNFDIQKFAKGCSSNQLQFFSSAYACSCAEYEITPNQSIENIQVFTINDFSSDFPADSEVSSIFKLIGNTHPDYLIEKYPINQADLIKTFELIDHYSIAIYLDEAPSFTRIVQFKIIVSLSDGTEFETITEPKTIVL